MVITEEQRRRAEANRLAALEKRKRLAEAAAAAATASTSYNTTFPASGTPTFPTDDTAAEWRLAKCPRIAPPAPQSRFVSLPPRPSPPPPPQTPPQPPVGFKVVLEVCSPDEFLVAVGPAEGKAYPGEANCLGAVQDCLAAASVVQYSATQSQSQSCHLRPVFKLVDYDVVSKSLKKLPGAVVEEIPPNTMKIIQDIPMLPGQKWASDKEVDELLKKLPQQVKDSLLPFQLEGVRFGLRRRGRCLIADEMGLGKTLQGGLEYILMHFNAGNCNSMLLQGQGLYINSVSSRIALYLGGGIRALGSFIYAKRYSSWPHILGRNKFDYAKKYCSLHVARSYQGKSFMDYSKGTRLTELNVLLSQTVMIRRLKEHLLNELPPKRRQIIRLKLKAPDVRTATSSSIKETNSISCNGTLAIDLPSKSNDQRKFNENESTKDEDDGCKKSPRHLSPQEIGIAKLSGFSEWFSNHFIMNGLGANHNLDPQSSCQKTIIFAHHLKVLDGIQVKVAIIGITAGGVGLDFSSAQNVVFVELPKSASELLQAEDRAHRRGQTNAVNIYIFCGKNTSDESHWLQLNQSLFRVSSLMNGKKDAIREIEYMFFLWKVDQVCHLEEIRNTEEKMQSKLHPLENHNADLDFDSDFTIRTIPLEFEDEIPGTSLKINPTPRVAGDRSCIDVSLSPAAAFCTAISSCKSMKGLLKGGSKRRATPLNDVSNPLPENAEWRQVVLCNGTTKERHGKLAKSPEYFEDLFCGLACFQEYRLRTSGRALRQALFQIERGKCSQCTLDCSKLVRHIKPLSMEKREEYIRKAAPNIANRKNLLNKLVREPIDGNAWHADHIIPVYKGGGECNLENMRTLCVACHYVVTRAQHKELKEIRKKAKEHLKNALNQQKDKASEATEEIDVSSLLVTVPGSSYSIGHEVTADANEMVAE
nr:unnamed protein product [Digitaria exilis]